VLILTVVLVRGIRESAGTNNVMVLLKITAIGVFIIAGSRFIHPAHWHPFFPNGWSGLLTGGSIIFFTYIGFDSVSTAAEECHRPQRDVPIGILGTLVVCTLLYIGVAVVLTGLIPWQALIDNAAPVVNTLKKLSHDTGSGMLNWVRLVVLCGAMMGMISSILVFQLGQARVWFAMSRDRLLPDVFSRIHPTFKTPHISTWVAGFLVGIPSGIFDISWFSDLSNIGTLFAFILVSAGVIVLRKKQPERRRGFRVPWVPLLPGISIVCCLVLMLSLPLETWIRFFVWLVIGLFIYFFYSQKRTRDMV
jgi:APA family basic amino acid/polyamine antiporter